jgi:hypothetical protein
MHHPQVIAPSPFIGLAITALLPSAAMVNASRIVSRASSGNPSKVLRAGVSQDTGRVDIIFPACYLSIMLA